MQQGVGYPHPSPEQAPAPNSQENKGNPYEQPQTMIPGNENTTITAPYVENAMFMQQQAPPPPEPALPMYPPIPGVPVGLEPLVGIDSMSIRQQLEMLEIMFDIETNNRYEVYNNYGKRIFLAGENTDWAYRCFMGKHRPFMVHIINGEGQTVMTVERRCNCMLCFFGGDVAGSDITIKSAYTQEVYGRILQRYNPCCPTYEIVDKDGKTVMMLRGPLCGTFCPICMCCDAQFTVSMITPQGEQPLGIIMKKFEMQELISDANNFGMRFPYDLNPQMKAVLLGAIFCIDFSFFESDTGNTCSCAPGLSLLCKVLLVLLIVGGIALVMFVVTK